MQQPEQSDRYIVFAFDCKHNARRKPKAGEVAERLNALVLKTSKG